MSNISTLMGSVNFVEEICYKCFTHYAMDSALRNSRLEDGDLFYCPNGHGQYYTESTVSKLKKQLESATKRLGYAEANVARAHMEIAQVKSEKAAIKGQLTKTRKRIANGVCPCCHRTFSNVAKHMDSKHPDFKEVV